MSKRIKRVFSSASQVMHIWASQSQDSGRSSNVFFEGDTIYSYGYHYPLGKITTFKGKQVACINTTGYSVTTAKHISEAKSAASHMIRVYTDKTFDIEAGLAKEKLVIETELESCFRKRSLYYRWNESYISQAVINFNEKVKLLKLASKFKIKLAKDFEAKYNAHFEKCAARNLIKDQKLAEKRKIERLEQLEQAKIDLVSWLSGGNFTSNLHQLSPQRLRVKDNEVQTTKGASVPLSHAIRLLKLVKRNEARQGERVGHFTLDRINDSGTVNIGCHEIAISEAERILSPYLNVEVITNDETME